MVFDVFFGSKWIRQLLVALVGKLLFFASGIRCEGKGNQSCEESTVEVS